MRAPESWSKHITVFSPKLPYISLFIYLLGANQKEHRLTDVVKRDGDQGSK